MDSQADLLPLPLPLSVACRIWHRDELLRELTPKQGDQLRTRIVIAALGEAVWADFSAAYSLFASGQAATERHACIACKTIEKFGEAIQFREDFIVEFLRLP